MTWRFFLSKKTVLTALALCIVSKLAYTQDISPEWNIRIGNCKNCIKQFVNEPAECDFSIFNENLYLTDESLNQIRIFDKIGKNIRNIPLPAKAEIVTMLGSRLFILLHNNSLGICDLKSDSITLLAIDFPLSKMQYEGSFFLDSVLAIPLKDELFSERSDARVINLEGVVKNRIVADLFDFGRIITLPPDSSFKHTGTRLINLRGGNSRYLVVDRFENEKDFQSSGFILYDRKENKIRKLNALPEKYGILMGSNVGRGVKIFNGKIYFISETMDSKKNSILVSSAPL